MADFNVLLDGYRRFRTDSYSRQRARYDELVQGQSPKTMIVACSDSRVDPTIVFDAAPGQMFVIRNVANLVPPYETGGGRHGVSAALEFAVTQLQVEDVVVMGHGACGGIHASLTGAFDGADHGDGGFIASWMSMIAPARDAVRAAGHANGQLALEYAAIRLSLENLLTFPFVKARVDAGDLTLWGAHFAIADGLLRVMDPVTGDFSPADV